MDRIPLVHPGELFKRHYIDTLKGFMGGKIDVDPMLALTLSELTGTTSQFWINLQEYYDKEKQ